jgi:hypothetical protein
VISHRIGKHSQSTRNTFSSPWERLMQQLHASEAGSLALALLAFKERVEFLRP